MSGKIPDNFVLSKCSEDSLKKLLVRDLKAITNSLNLSMHNIRAPSRKKSYIERILKHRDQKEGQQHAIPQTFEHFKAANPMLIAFKENEEKMKKLSMKMKGLNMKLTTLNELKKSGMKVETKMISDALKSCSAQMNGFTFRRLIITKIVNKIQKQELKIAKNKNISTLSDFVNKFIRSKEEIIKKRQNNIDELENKRQCLNGELAQICSIPNEMDVDRVQQIKREVMELESTKDTEQSAMKQIGCQIDGFRILLNEISNREEIDCNVWIQLSSNKRVKNVINIPIKTPMKKQKFKRPTRSSSKRPTTRKVQICDVLPKKLCSIKLSSSIINNGMVLGCGQRMSKSNESLKREEWINDYNNVHLNEFRQKFKSIYGKDINLKPLQSHSIIEQNIEMNEEMEQGEGEDDECINDSESDEGNDDSHTNAFFLSAQPILSQNAAAHYVQRQSKQTLNVSSQKYNPFKPRHQKRHRVRANKSINKMGQAEAVNIDREHPLIASDPFLKAMQSKNDNNCLHWVAMGVCAYKDSGRCRYEHPPKFAANNFICPRNECNKQNCAYCHDPTRLPSKDYNEQELESWEQAKIEKQKAFEQWVANKTEKDKNLASRNTFDEAASFAVNDPFTSVLAE